MRTITFVLLWMVVIVCCNGSSSPPQASQNLDFASMYSSHRPLGSAASNPIDYEFQIAKPKSSSLPSKNDKEEDEEDNLPDTTTTTTATAMFGSSPSEEDEVVDGVTTATTMNARKDPIALYRKTWSGRMKLAVASTCMGGCLGFFLDQSLMGGKQKIFTFVFVTWFLVMITLHRNGNSNVSDWMLTLGMIFIQSIKNVRRIKQDYPTRPYIRSALFASQPRKVFPPNTNNPWQYEDGSYFQMIPTVAAMGFIGSICAAAIPIIPTWMSGIVGAALFVYITTLPSSRGDLCRIMGMRLVALLKESYFIQRDYDFMHKTRIVFFQFLDRIMIFDRKHKVKDKIQSILSFLYNKALQIQSDMNNNNNNDNTGNDTNNDRRPPTDDRRPRNDGRRPPYDDRRPRNDDRRPPPPRNQQRDNNYENRYNPNDNTKDNDSDGFSSRNEYRERQQPRRPRQDYDPPTPLSDYRRYPDDNEPK